MDQYPIKAGVGVMIIKDGNVLLGKRKNAHGAGEYAFTGGHLEHLEGFADCAQRETREETGIEITNVRFLCLVNLTQYAPKHYVHIQMIADWASGEPTVLEPEKSETWDWHPLDDLPSPRFGTCDIAVQAYRTGQTCFDITDLATE